MIIAALIYFVVYLSRQEAKAWDLAKQAASHEACADPNLPGHQAAMEWADTAKARAEALRLRGGAVESMLAVLGRYTAGAVAALAVLRIAADAMHAAGVAVADPAAAFGWATVVDGIDTLLWLALVV
jgi:hypothetical protein